MITLALLGTVSTIAIWLTKPPLAPADQPTTHNDIVSSRTIADVHRPPLRVISDTRRGSSRTMVDTHGEATDPSNHSDNVPSTTDVDRAIQPNPKTDSLAGPPSEKLDTRELKIARVKQPPRPSRPIRGRMLSRLLRKSGCHGTTRDGLQILCTERSLPSLGKRRVRLLLLNISNETEVVLGEWTGRLHLGRSQHWAISRQLNALKIDGKHLEEVTEVKSDNDFKSRVRSPDGRYELLEQPSDDGEQGELLAYPVSAPNSNVQISLERTESWEVDKIWWLSTKCVFVVEARREGTWVAEDGSKTMTTYHFQVLVLRP